MPTSSTTPARQLDSLHACAAQTPSRWMITINSMQCICLHSGNCSVPWEGMRGLCLSTSVLGRLCQSIPNLLNKHTHVTRRFVCDREHRGEYHGIPEPDAVGRSYAQFLDDHPEAREEEVHPRKVGVWWAAR